MQSVSSAIDTVEQNIRKQPLLSISAVLFVGVAVGYAVKSSARPPRRMQRLQNFAGTNYRSRDLERAIKRLEKAYDRNAPAAYNAVRDGVSGLPDMIGALAQAWQTTMSPKLRSVRDALPDMPDVKSAAAEAAKRWTK